MKKVAVIGLGNIAHRHRQNLKFLFPQAAVYAMSSRGRTAEESLANCDGMANSVEDLIRLEVELVIVASPAPFHHAQAIPLLHAQIPTLVEKPLSNSLQNALAIQAAALHCTTPMMVGYCLKFMSSAQKLKQLLDDGLIGRLHNVFVEAGQYLPDWRPHLDFRSSVSATPELGGGVLLELSHEFDYLFWLFGALKLEHAIVRSVSDLKLDVEDMADVILSTTQGAVINVHLDFVQKQPRRICRLVGERGVLEWDLLRNEISHSSADGSDVVYRDPTWQANDMYLDMLRALIQQVKSPQEPAHRSITAHTGVATALDTVALVESIKQNFSQSG